jgi:5-methylcytosine-specific restriction protein B
MKVVKPSGPTFNSSSKPQTWIFQANPNKYRIEESLQVEQAEYWNLNQHARKVRAGDRVLIWISGKDAGIYALGTVVDDPYSRPDSPAGISYWYNPVEGQQVKPRVLVRYNRIFLDRPLHKVFLEFDPVLSNMKILRFAQGTNFAVTEEEWLAINSWLDEPLVDTQPSE